MEMVVYVVLVSETPLPITEKENQPIHFVFLLQNEDVINTFYLKNKKLLN
jgi:hypothetical protein